MLTVAFTAIGSAVAVAMDTTEGIIARFRTMAIHRGSVLIGHVVGSVLQCVTSVALVGAVAVALGFRSTDATAVEWILAVGLVALLAPALNWIAVGMGLSSPSPEAAGDNALPLMILPLLSSAFVPVDAMPGWFPAGRRVPAVHPGRRDPARAAARHRDRPQRMAGRRPVPRAGRARLLLVHVAVRPRPGVDPRWTRSRPEATAPTARAVTPSRPPPPRRCGRSPGTCRSRGP